MELQIIHSEDETGGRACLFESGKLNNRLRRQSKQSHKRGILSLLVKILIGLLVTMEIIA